MKNPSRFEMFGIRESVKPAWMDEALRGVLSGNTEAECREKLWQMISNDTTEKGPRGKTTVVKNMALVSSWYAPKDGMERYVSQLAEHAADLPEAEWSALHWALLAATYPFFLSVSNIAGRLLGLQENFTKSQALRRLEEIYGTPGMIERNLRYALSILANFGFLQCCGRNGIYSRTASMTISDDRTALLLWKAILHGTKGGRVPLANVRNSPAFFPFSLPTIYPSQFREAFEDVDISRYVGMDDLLFLKEE